MIYQYRRTLWYRTCLIRHIRSIRYQIKYWRPYGRRIPSKKLLYESVGSGIVRYGIEGTLMCLREISWEYVWYRSTMISSWLGLHDGQRSLIWGIDNITRRICEDPCISMYRTVTVANDQGPWGMQHFESSNHCQLLRSHCDIFHWILL